ncbi:MAG: GLUG motif-containing protein [Dehalococcoidia bacterium]
MKNRMLSISVVAVLALSIGLVSCGGQEVPEITEYTLTISSTEGGSVTTPGEGNFTYDEGTDVNLVAKADEGYEFVTWTGDVDDVADTKDATTTITMKNDYAITANFAVKQYSLIARSTEGGSVTTPGENAYTYEKGEVVNLVAVADESYQFINWTGDVSTIADVNAASTTITMNGGYSIIANFAGAIRDWYDLDAIRDNLGGMYILMNDLDANTAGYAELASPAADGGKGWEPIGGLPMVAATSGIIDPVPPFTGSLDGQGYVASDLFINRPDQDAVGLFGGLDPGGIIQDVSVAHVTATGRWSVGCLVGTIDCGTVSNSYSHGSVTGYGDVGGLVGRNHDGTVSNSCSTGSVTGEWHVGGLVGCNEGTVSNSHYNYDEVLINGRNIITIGALFGEDFEQWLASDKSLDVNERLSQEDGYYVINNVSDLKQLLAFGQDGSLKFRLESDLDLGSNPNFYVPYLAGEFDGNGHKIRNLSFQFDFVLGVGLFGNLAPSGKVSELDVESVNITGNDYVGGLVGDSKGTVSSCYSKGSVTGGSQVGGLVGFNKGTVSNAYSTANVIGQFDVGGLLGLNYGPVTNSYYSYDEVLINGRNIITIGALSNEDFEQWLANDKFLDVNERLSQEDGYYVINNVSDLKQLLAFGQDGLLKFRLKDDLNLATEPNFYIPYFAGEFDGNGHKISNLSFNFDFVSGVGLFGHLASTGKVTQVGIENVNITGSGSVGGLVGDSRGGTVTNCYSTGSVTSDGFVGGLLGDNAGTVNDSYSTTRVTGDRYVGGLVGWNEDHATVSNSYSTGSVTGEGDVGGLVGANYAAVSNSLWDIQTSGQSTSAGGTGKTTAAMQNIATFSGAAWDIIAVALGVSNPAYTWNIVDGQTYPFLSWQSI